MQDLITGSSILASWSLHQRTDEIMLVVGSSPDVRQSRSFDGSADVKVECQRTC
jgi:hypothetical protein